MPDSVSEQYTTEMLLARLLTKHKIEKRSTTSSRTLEWATSCLAAWLNTGGSTTSPEVRLLLQVIEEEVRWLKRQNDDHQQRIKNPTEVAKKLAIKARPPAQLPPATYKMLTRTGFQYRKKDQTWTAWDDDATRAVVDVMTEQGHLFGG
jgi:hypothetical protein